MLVATVPCGRWSIPPAQVPSDFNFRRHGATDVLLGLVIQTLDWTILRHMWRAMKDHFNQDANLVGTALALGGITLGAVLIIAFHDFADRAVLVLLAVFAAAPGLVVLLVRLIRAGAHLGRRGQGACTGCGRVGSTSPVRYLQVTGLLVVLVMREQGGHLCRTCSARLFLRATLHDLVLGWWGIFSLFLTPGFVLNNMLFLLRSQILVGSGHGFARTVLDDQREYIQNLARTKDEETVLGVLEKSTGLPREEIVDYLHTLPR